MAVDFSWRDGERTIRFGAGAVDDAPGLLGDGYTLLTTPRARETAPALAQAAATVRHVGPGLVDELAGALLDEVAGDLLVALGGGRVIDVVKALAAARPGRQAAAIPTTLSAAEMTRIHRHAAGVDPATPHVRAAIVIVDPALCASQPEPGLAASAANALGHAVDGAVSVGASPVPVLAAHEAARLLATGLPADGEPDREALALGALLSGYTIDQNGYGLHHVLAQTARTVGGAGHGPANAALLPHTLRALRARFPDALAAFGDVEALAARLAQRAGAVRLRDLGVSEEALERCVAAALRRPELAATPPPPDADEIRSLYRAAW